MAKKDTGYNNPAFCNQFDNSLYDYEYVPEIDPDSPDLKRIGSYRPPRQIPPTWPHNDLNKSNSSSDGSVIIEERNNRRVTLICEKRKPKVQPDKDGGYSHDISYESDSNNENENVQTIRRQAQKSNTYYGKDRMAYEHPPMKRQPHRYEDLGPPPSYDEHILPDRRHRYAEISDELETEGVHFTHRKPRAPSPGYYGESTSFPSSPNFESFGTFRQSSPFELSNSFEMSDFSPTNVDFNQRQPPLGAAANHVPEPRIIQEKRDLARTPSKKEKVSTPRKTPKHSTAPKLEERTKQSVRRNISSSFQCDRGSPYRSTTQTIQNSPRCAAIITPILQRKFADLTGERSNFQKASRMFQSTPNIQKAESRAYQQQQNNFNIPVGESKMRRNQSVRNFQQHYENRSPSKIRPQDYPLNFSPEKFSPLSKSRLSLLDTIKSSSEQDDLLGTPSNGCLLLAAVVQLLAGMITCAICFYLLSKLGRRYYLELGTISGFVTTVLGALGFRSHRWKWLPNRNYVSAYTILAGFSILNAASVVLIVLMKPSSGEPILDVCAGAICAVSVIVVVMALTGLTMSGCCKSPPPDNRVTII